MHRIRVLDVGAGVLAFYDGRVEGYRFSDQPNWVDDGALSLGIASYAIVSGREALVYDTHVSVEHARFVRRELEARGAQSFTVVLSHWHLDHVAGTAVFADSEIIASERTTELLTRHQTSIERGELEGPPPIDPLLLPTTSFADEMSIVIGDVEVMLIHTNIHSDDATVAWLPRRSLLLCGDTLEDPVTYVDEPQGFDDHLTNLQRLRELAPSRVLPNHGDPGVIAAGGYSPELITATERYIVSLQQLRSRPQLQTLSLHQLLADPLRAGWINYFAPYEAVHRRNVELVLSASAEEGW